MKSFITLQVDGPITAGGLISGWWGGGGGGANTV